MIDKWTHIVFYVVLTLCLIIEYYRYHKSINCTHSYIITIFVPLLMGGLIEIVQATCTNDNRSGDWYDFLADAIGIVLAQIIGILLAKCFSKKRKDA